MNNEIEYIPSGSVGEIYLDMIDEHWYMCESTKYAKEKVLPFFKFLYDLLGVRVRDRANNNSLTRNELVPQRILQVIKTTTEIIKGFNKLRSLTDDLFCTGDIQTIDYAIEGYKQYETMKTLTPFFIMHLK